MAKTYGKVAVTAVGMFSKEAVWFIPHGSATILLTVGSNVSRTAHYILKGEIIFKYESQINTHFPWG